MSYHSPTYMFRGGSLKLGIIHEQASQNIQGGLPGQHYHLSLDELNSVINNKNYRFEPVAVSSAELVFVNSGDVVMTRVSRVGE